MKNYNHIFFIPMLLSGITTMQAYKEPFSNHTDKTIAIGMKYKGSNNLEFIVIQPYGEQQFEPGTSAIVGVKSAIDSNKINAIPSNWYYLINPPYINDDNKNNLSWTFLNIIWFRPDTYKTILTIAKNINKSDKSAKSIAEIIKSESQNATPEIIQQFIAADYNLESFIRTIGKNVGHSMAQDFHIDIIEDENGNIHFISPL